MVASIEINQGEVKIKFTEAKSGKLSFQELGLKNEDLFVENGMLRLVFNMDGIGEHHYFKMPTVEISYIEEVGETHWQCDFNRETILDTLDHHGHSTVLLLNRNRLAALEHHHENRLVVHAEFPEAVHIDVENSYVNFFK